MNILKKFLRIVVIVVAFLLLLVILEFALNISADADLKNKNYESAVVKYELLVKLNPENVNLKSRLADALLGAPFDYENQKLISEFMEKYKGQSFAYLLEQKLAKFKAGVDLKIGRNYIYKSLYNNKVMHWEDDAFPLKVYIPDSTIAEPVKRAFDYWSYATGNFISFDYIDNIDDADIKVEIADTAKANCEGCAYVVALTTPNIKRNILDSMSIKFNEKNPYGVPYPSEEIYKVALHEIGHALGIVGHSDNPDNLMYASGNEQSADFAEYHSVLTREDINTLKILYMLAPDISNVPSSERNLKNKIYPSALLGTEKEIKMRNIEDAKNYISKAPNLSIGYIDLGNAYVQADMYNESLQAYNQALKLAIDNDERYIVAFNVALVYLEVNKRDKALEYAKYAQKIKPNPEIDKFIEDIQR